MASTISSLSYSDWIQFIGESFVLENNWALKNNWVVVHQWTISDLDTVRIRRNREQILYESNRNGILFRGDFTVPPGYPIELYIKAIRNTRPQILEDGSVNFVVQTRSELDRNVIIDEENWAVTIIDKLQPSTDIL